MADTVIVVGTKRGQEHVSSIDLKQMIGRAGRKHGGRTALAQIIVEEERAKEVQDELDNGTNMEVKSSFEDMDKIFFHMMPEIAAGNITDVVSAEKWFGRSLSFHQGRVVKFSKVFARMEKMGAVRQEENGGISPTRIGEIASALYFHPGDVQAWKDNFDKVFEMGLENDNAAIAWALGTRTHGKSHGDFGDNRFVIEEFKSALPMGLEPEPGTVIQEVLWWCAMGGPPTGRMRNAMLALREDIGRIKRALVRIDKEVAKWNRVEVFEDVELMVRKGVKFEMLELCKLPGITKGRADFLYNMGATDAASIEDIMPNIDGEIDESFTAALKEIIRGLPRTSS
jgi:replicative superfamily II helicase